MDRLLEKKLNEPTPPTSFPDQIKNDLRYSLMPELRKAILEKVKSTPIHPPARWVYRQIEQLFPDASLRSVCRHLFILTAEGHIQQCCFGEGFKRFDRNLEPHCHFICLKCNGICDICQPPQQLIDLHEIQNMGYETLEPKLEVRGICKNCRVV
jgi:Fur family peroxide stress response transcriptional regulator